MNIVKLTLEGQKMWIVHDFESTLKTFHIRMVKFSLEQFVIIEIIHSNDYTKSSLAKT